MSKTDKMKTLAKKTVAAFKRAAVVRANWENHWQAIATYVLPAYSFTVDRTKGGERRRGIYNDTATRSAIELAAAMEGLLFNTSIRWFELGTDSEKLNKEETDYFYKATNTCLAYLDNPDTNFSIANHEVAISLSGFGTGVVLPQVSDGMLKFQSRSLVDMFGVEDDTGTIVENFRHYKLPLWELVDQFGLKNISEESRKMYNDDTKNRDTEIEVIHHIYKRKIRNPEKKDGRNKPWASLYIEEKQVHVLKDHGFRKNPYIMPRWSKAPKETYGRSPAMEVLPSIRVVNAASRMTLEAGELIIRPPMAVMSGSIEGTLRTAPGSIVTVRSGTRQMPEPLNTGSRPDVGEKLLDRHEAKIDKAFFLDRFNLPDHDRMTAEEVITHRQQGLIIMSPVLSRLYAEWLNPQIVATYEWLRSENRIPAPPETIAGRELRINYISPMAVARRSSESDSFQGAMGTSALLVQADPAVMDNLDTDKAFRGIFRSHNANPEYLRSEKDVELRRQARADKENEAEALANAATAGSTAKDVAGAVKDLGATV